MVFRHKIKRMEYRQLSLLLLLISLSVLSLIGCERNEPIGFHQPTSHPDLIKDQPIGLFFGEEIKRITTIQGELNKVSGWLNDDIILYVSDIDTGSNLYKYHLYTGESELLYESDVPIAEVIISPSKEKILLHLAPSTHLGGITIIDRHGKQVANVEIDSFELYFAWNRLNENQLYIAAFLEDWTYETSLLHIDRNEMTTVYINDPFIQWVAKEEVAFLEWDTDSPTLTAPLIKKNVRTDELKTLSKHVIDFASFTDHLLYVRMSEQDRNIAEYSLLNKQQQKQFSFTAPLLTRYSGWLVPFYDFHSKQQIFYTFRSLRSADADMYGDKFQLVAYHVKNNKEHVLLDKLDNEPISLSPSGKYLLYGYRFDKIIHLETSEVISLTD